MATAKLKAILIIAGASVSIIVYFFGILVYVLNHRIVTVDRAASEGFYILEKENNGGACASVAFF